MLRKPIQMEHEIKDRANIVFVDWALGNSCNYSCSYCPPSLHDGSIRWQDSRAVMNVSADILAHFRCQRKSVFFHFSGGEPTLYPALPEIMRFIKSKRGLVGVISNGSRPVAWWREAMQDLDQVDLTFHLESTPIQHFLALTQMLAVHVATHVNVTMLPDRFDECERIANTLSEFCSMVTISRKPLLVGFGSKLYPYSNRLLKNT